MIQPGQKLKEGDYFQGGSKEQYEELFKIEGQNGWINQSLNASMGYGFTVFHCGVLVWYFDERETEYNFTDFRQLCVNTFGDGAK